MELWVKCEMLAGISGVLGGWSGVDPGFEIGGCPKCARKHEFFFQCHTHLSSQLEVVANYYYEALCGHCY